MRRVRAESIYLKFTALKNSSLSLETSNSLALKKKKKNHQKHMDGFNFNPTLEHILLNLVCILFRVIRILDLC